MTLYEKWLADIEIMNKNLVVKKANKKNKNKKNKQEA